MKIFQLSSYESKEHIILHKVYFQRKNQRCEMDKNKVLFCFKSLLFSYILTGLFLLLLALLLYRLHLSEKLISFCITVIYIGSNFFLGFITGKKMQNRKFLWGLCMGIVYFLVLAVVSIIADHSIQNLAADFFLTLFLCAGSGMLGGMLS